MVLHVWFVILKLLVGCEFKPCQDTCFFLEQDTVFKFRSTGWSKEKKNWEGIKQALSFCHCQAKNIDLAYALVATLFKQLYCTKQAPFSLKVLYHLLNTHAQQPPVLNGHILSLHCMTTKDSLHSDRFCFC